jgi:hypothetical protein
MKAKQILSHEYNFFDDFPLLKNKAFKLLIAFPKGKNFKLILFERINTYLRVGKSNPTYKTWFYNLDKIPKFNRKKICIVLEKYLKITLLEQKEFMKIKENNIINLIKIYNEQNK